MIMKNIEYNIVKHDYARAFHYCRYLMFLMDKNNYDKYLSVDSQQKLRRYRGILENYCRIYEPMEFKRIINIKFPN